MEARWKHSKEDNIMIDVQKDMQSTLGTLAQFTSKMADVARVDAVFGQPVERGDTTIIPCCVISVGGGMGFGSGPSGGNEQRQMVVGQGGGAGGGATGRPIAVIVMSPDGVRVEPILDMTKVVLATFTTATFVLIQLSRLMRLTRTDKGKKPSFPRLKKAIERR